MSARCPHLGLEGNRKQVYLVSSSRHRCYVTSDPQRVAGAYQASVCLTSAYRRCPRLLITAEGSEGQPTGRKDSGDLAAAQSGAPPKGKSLLSLATAGDRPRYTDLRTATALRQRSGPQRKLTLTEGIVLALAACITLAIFFVGYVVFYRLRVGPGMAAPAVAGAATSTAQPTETLPPSSTPTPSLTPEPMPEAEVTPEGVVPAAPTSLPEPTLPSEATANRPPATSPPTRLVLPSIGLDVPVRPVGVKTLGEGATARTVWSDLPNAAGFHNTSAYPGNPGNTVINGHRDIHAAVFRHLDKVKVGDEITLYVGSLAYPYQVTEILIVPETFATAAQRVENQRLIGPMPEERLTLVTCTPVGLATHRLLVIARPPEEVAPQGSQAGKSASP